MAPTKPTTAPAFQFYPKDFLSSTKVQRMSLVERGIYITLLSHCWLDNGLPVDMPTLARIVGMRAAQFDRLWSLTLHECFAVRGGKLHNGRLMDERRKQDAYRQAQRDNGIRSGEARRAIRRQADNEPPLNDGSTKPEPTVNQTGTKSNSPISYLLSSSPSSVQTPQPPKGGESFDAFWSVYPNKKGKDAAKREWVRRKPDAALVERIIASVRAQCESADWRKDGGQFIPHPRTWLHQGRWQDEPRQASGPTHIVEQAAWVCPHVIECSQHRMCESRMLHPEKYPLKVAS